MRCPYWDCGWCYFKGIGANNKPQGLATMCLGQTICGVPTRMETQKQWVDKMTKIAVKALLGNQNGKTNIEKSSCERIATISIATGKEVRSMRGVF